MRRCFSIRDLLWLTQVVALVVRWWVDRRNSSELLAESQRQIVEYQRREKQFGRVYRAVNRYMKSETEPGEVWDALRSIPREAK